MLPMASTVASLIWGAFLNAGQTCVGVKRIYVMGDVEAWANALARAAEELRVGDPAAGVVDMGPMISEAVRTRFHVTIGNAVDAGADILTGGMPIDSLGTFYRPTVLRGRTRAPKMRSRGCSGRW